jgi:uncharacterized membrane protein
MALLISSSVIYNFGRQTGDNVASKNKAKLAGTGQSRRHERPYSRRFYLPLFPSEIEATVIPSLTMLDHSLSHLPPLIVLALFFAAVFATARTLPMQNVLGATCVIVFVSGFFEMLNAERGIPFGPLFYTNNLGVMFFHLIPWPIPLIWVVIIFNSRGVARLIIRPWRGNPRYGLWFLGVACMLAVLTDAALEPVAHANHWWFWRNSKYVLTWYTAPWTNFAARGAVTLLILGFIVPLMIDKKAGNQPSPETP